MSQIFNMSMEKTEFVPTKECPKCRARNELTAKFCSDCSQPLLDENDFIICKNCNTNNEISSRFCKSCGKQIKDDVYDSDILLLQKYLGDKFFISKPLGEGGFGRVFLAEHKALGRKEVIKLLGFEQSKNPEIKARFLQEARILASLNHPGIINIRDVSEAEGRPYYIMEYKDRGSLHDFLIKNQPLQLHVVRELILKILKALSVIHKKGILHRDLKPDNVLMNEEGEPVLIDFGIARLEDGDSSNKTKTGIALGTPAYMSPEQWEGKKISECSDLYSIGILFYELLTGQVPFASLEVFSKELPRSSSLPENLYIFLQKACAKDPLNRFSSAEEMTQALENLTFLHKQARPNFPLKEDPSVLQIEEVIKPKRFSSEFINDFIYPFRKDLTWKSILIKQLRIFLSISVIPFIFFFGLMEFGLKNFEFCQDGNMILKDGFCFFESDRINYENATNTCFNNEISLLSNSTKIDQEEIVSNDRKLKMLKEVQKFNSVDYDNCMSITYTGKINEEYPLYEKVFSYQIKALRIYSIADSIFFFLIINYPAYLFVQLIIWIFKDANKRFDIGREKSELDKIEVPFKENFSLMVYINIILYLYTIYNQDFLFSIFHIGVIIFFISSNRKIYKNKKIYELREDEENNRLEEEIKLRESRILIYSRYKQNKIENEITTVGINPIDKNIYIHKNSSEGLCNSTQIFEYKISTFDIFFRCIYSDYKSYQWNQNEKYINDGIVLESEILKNFEESNKDSIYKKSEKEVLEYIDRLKASTEWYLLIDNRIKYFILFHDNKLIPDLKKYFLMERERIRVGFLKFKNHIKKSGYQIIISNYCNTRNYNIKLEANMNDIDTRWKKIHSEVKSYNITIQEFEDSRKISMFLYLLIKKLG